jgi:hypothetical protein
MPYQICLKNGMSLKRLRVTNFLILQTIRKSSMRGIKKNGRMGLLNRRAAMITFFRHAVVSNEHKEGIISEPNCI